MPNKYYRLSPLAESDLEEIWIYTFQNWSIGQADTYISSFVATFEALSIGKKQGQPADVRQDYKKYLCGSHMIYYLESSDRLDIIRILHQRQDANLHLE
ncbi:MAG: type II toxin-antitoxin system RelE/ParE family toxin [Saezia sp.]